MSLAGALILIISEAGSMRNVYEDVENLDMVRETKMMAGPYDIMIIAESDKLSNITETLTNQIRNIDGVGETLTHIFID